MARRLLRVPGIYVEVGARFAARRPYRCPVLADFGGRLILQLKDPKRTELVVSRDRVRPLKDRLGLT